MPLHDIQVKILKYINNYSKNIDIEEKLLSQKLNLNKKVIHYHINLLAEEEFIKSALEINNCGYDEHLCIEIADKGDIYLENYNYLKSEREKLYIKSEKCVLNMEENFRLIINFINETKLYFDCDIADGLNIDLDTVRYCLEEMSKYRLITLIEGENFGVSCYSVAKITPRGKLFVKGDIDFDSFSSANNQKTIHINNGNYNESIEGNYFQQSHSGSGDNVGRDKNTTNIYNSQDLTQAAADIQALLEQLDKTYDINKTAGKMTIARSCY